MSWVIVVFLELFLHASAGPGWFYEDRRPTNQGSHGSKPATPSWGAWGSSWDYHQMIHTQNGYLAYNGGSTEQYTPQVHNPTPRPTKKQTTGVVYSTNAATGGTATGGNNAIVTSEASLVTGDDRRNVAGGEIRPVSGGEANQHQNFDQVPQNNRNHKNKGEISSVSSGEAIKNHNIVPVSQNNRNHKNKGEISPVSSGEANKNQNVVPVPQKNRNHKNKGEISPVSSGEANKNQNVVPVPQKNRNHKHKGEISLVSIGEANENQNFDQIPHNNRHDQNIGEISPVIIGEANENQNFDQIPHSNRHDQNVGEINPVPIGEANENQNFHQIPQNNRHDQNIGEISPVIIGEANENQNFDQIPHSNRHDQNVGEISVVSIGEANENQNFHQIPQNNRHHQNIGEINPVIIGEANENQNFDQFMQNNRHHQNIGEISPVPIGKANEHQNFHQIPHTNRHHQNIGEISPVIIGEANENQNFHQIPQNNRHDQNIGEISLVSIGEANENQNFDQFLQNNRHDQNMGEISPVFIGEANHNQNFDQVPQNNKNVQNKYDFQNTPKGTTTAKPEEELTFGAAAIGSKPVPTLNDTSEPAFHWHVGVYSKMWTPYMQICGGSLVKKDVILSAAHCFWTDPEGQQPATQFAVAGGKLFRPWTSKKDQYAQRSDVSEIVLPVRFRGITTSFQDDIAVVRLSKPFVYAEGLRPVCVDFGLDFERYQLVHGSPGTVAGWGLTEENGRPSQRLNFLELPYVDIGHCLWMSEPSFVKYITSDKICAGDQKSGKALCRGDSGGGLVFYNQTTPYLRGIAPTAAANENLCNAFAIATFTQLRAHRTFLRDNIPDIDKECARNSDKTDAGTVNGDLVTGNGAESNIPFMSRHPYSNFFCNCNCKS